MAILDEILEKLTALDPKAKEALAGEVMKATGGRIWTPNPGAQTEAYFSEADEIGAGGEAGWGKTWLLVGLALTAHKRSLLLRKTKHEARRLASYFEQVLGHRDGLNANDGIWRLPDGRQIEYGGCEHDGDEQHYKGEPHDLLCFDEVVDFPRHQYEFLKQWNRTTEPGQRCRIVATFNPPTRAIGFWVFDHWRPWLDPGYRNPAKSGELRWFTTIDGRDTEVDGPGPHPIGGEMIRAKSRTFVFGSLTENVDLARSGYDATRAAAPEYLRKIYRLGDFQAALSDVPGQLIPSAWVKAAQARWTEKAPAGVPMCALGVDCSGGGDDPMVIAMRHDGWYAPLVEIPGAQLPPDRLGGAAMAHVVSHRRDKATVIVDLGGGYGGALFERLKENDFDAKGHNGAEASAKRTRDKKLGFYNRRAEVYWQFREALDPDQPGGSPIALPPDSRLVADLTTPTFEVVPRGVKLEPKEDLVERLGRSPDRGDAVVMAWSAGMTHLDLTNADYAWGAAHRRIKTPQRHPARPDPHEAIKNYLRRR